MSEVWTLPGYDVDCLLGFGATGEVWRARETATGEVVALKRLLVPVAAEEALRRTAAVLDELGSPHVVRLRDVVADGADVVLVLDHVGGGSLATLLGRRGPLTPGEVVTVAAPLAATLAALHEAGVVHGGVSAGNVLFRDDGMPLLSDVGLDAGDPASDVRALAALGRQLLDAQAPAALEEAVEAGLLAGPEGPDAAAFARLLRRACPPAPVRLHGGPAPVLRVRARGAHAAPPAPARRWRPPARLLVGAVSALVLVVAAGVGWSSGRAAAPVPALAAVPQPLAEPAPTPAPAASPDWELVVRQLAAARADAFTTGRSARLLDVYAPGSPALAADRGLLDRLAAAGQMARGLRHTVHVVEPLESGAQHARLRVVDELSAYELRDATGAVVASAPPRGAAAQLVELARTPQGWRLVSVAPAP